jgi:hypothetical protein
MDMSRWVLPSPVRRRGGVATTARILRFPSLTKKKSLKKGLKGPKRA